MFSWHSYNLSIFTFLEREENEVERTDDKAKSSINEDIRLRLGSIEQSHGQNHQQHYHHLSCDDNIPEIKNIIVLYQSNNTAAPSISLSY